ncbi:MAG: O-antigen ligase family protein, partial [Kiritimatiellaeota bacterium]|nr:O-antigen ligase family protein [Kiritimatiellota bacterium]
RKRFDFSVPGVAHAAASVLLAANLIISPWLYGSWEQWWFWPMFALLVAAGFFSGAGALAESVMPDARASSLAGRFRCSRKIAILGLSAIPFYLYALIRARFPSGAESPLVSIAVERSLLRMFAPLLIAFIAFFSLNRRRLHFLSGAVLANIAVIAFFGAVSHLFFKYTDEAGTAYDHVLWTRTLAYFGRLKGTFYCPNHFSIFIGLGICLLVAPAFFPSKKTVSRVLSGALAAALLFPNLLTQSRGGMMALVLALAVGVPLFAMRGYKSWWRFAMPAAFIVSLAVAVSVAVETTATGERLKGNAMYQVFFPKPGDNSKSGGFGERFRENFWYKFDRGRYISAALRAWESNPVWGIGPGMHSDRWSEFDAMKKDRNGNDVSRPVNGDWSQMRRPWIINDSIHLYEVHSDWTQLLEEYGAVGLALFLAPLAVLMWLLWGCQTLTLRKIALINSTGANGENSADDDSGDDSDDDDDTPESRSSRRRRRSRHHRVRDDIPWRSGERPGVFELSLPLAALLCGLVIFIHSLGDFALQIPAITWVFSFIITAGILSATRTHR